MPLFAELGQEMRATVLAEATLLRLPARKWLFRQGDEADALFVVSSGRLEIVREIPPPAVVVRQLGWGMAVGELALLTGTPRSAAARAVRDSELVVIRREEMLRLLHDSPPFAIALIRALGRLVQATEPATPRRERPGVLAVVPLGREVPVGALCDAIAGELGARARVAELREGDAAAAPRGSERFAAYGRLLDERERDHDHVVLVGDDDPASDWNAYCVRQADRVLAVATSTSSPQPNAGLALPAGCDVALWGRSSDSRRVVERWLRALAPRAHHFIEPGPRFAASVARAARRVTGRSVGIVLSGGAAAGLAHVGVVAALEAGGVAIDRVGGCSFGALVGGLYAAGHGPAELVELFRRELVRQNPFNDYTVPRRALLRGRKAELALRRVCGEVRIEQLALDYFCVSADLLTAEVVVHRRGDLADAVMASMSVPGIAPPVRHGGRLLVDGGILDNLPVDVMIDLDVGPVIAVDVMRRAPLGPGHGAPAIPSIHETLLRAGVLGSSRVSDRNRARAQLVIAPDVRGIGMLEFRRLDAIVEAGRVAAEAVVEEALALGRGGERLSPR
jgi:predicted acylesterase/phospholipase RssA/CRP-like cAMP-binding protein